MHSGECGYAKGMKKEGEEKGRKGDKREDVGEGRRKLVVLCTRL